MVRFGAIAAALLLVLCAEKNASAQQPRIATLLSKDLYGVPNREITMLTVTFAPGEVDAIHRHNAQVVVYVLEGSVVMQIKGGPERTLSPGQTFYEGPNDVHTVGRNASTKREAKFLVFFVKKKGDPILVPVK